MRILLVHLDPGGAAEVMAALKDVGHDVALMSDDVLADDLAASRPPQVIVACLDEGGLKQCEIQKPMNPHAYCQEVEKYGFYCW